MPFLDPQTGVAQNHSNLFFKKSQRIPGLRAGQIYTYPSQKWRTTRKRQYLSNANAYPFNYRPFGRFREHPEFEIPAVSEFIPAEEASSFRPSLAEDSKDSQRDDGSKSGWYYDEMDMHDMDNFDEDEDSDDDFMEPRSGRKKRSSRTPGSTKARKEKPENDGRRRSSGTRGRGGRKVNPPPMDNSSNSSDKFTDYSRRRTGNPPQVTTIQHANPMSFDEAIPEHKITMSTDRRMNFEDISHASTSGGTLSTILGSPVKAGEKGEKPRANPSTYCDFCLGDAKENKKTMQSEVRRNLEDF